MEMKLLFAFVFVLVVVVPLCPADVGPDVNRPTAVFQNQNGEVLLVGKVTDAYPIEMHFWDETLTSHTDSVMWHVFVAVESPKELRGLKPNLVFPAGGLEGYGHLVGRTVTVRLKREQASALFIDVDRSQIHEGRDADAPATVVRPISPAELTSEANAVPNQPRESTATCVRPPAGAGDRAAGNRGSPSTSGPSR